MTETPPQPHDDEAAASLDQQLDEMLARIAREEPDALPDPATLAEAPASDGEDPDDALESMIDRQVDDAIAAAESAMTRAPGADDDAPPDAEADLSGQVQAMLDESDTGRAARRVDVEALASDADDIEEIDGEISGSFHAPEVVADPEVDSDSDAEVSPSAAPEPAPVAAAAGDDEDADLAELDRLLADEADDAIAGDFESPDDFIDDAAAAAPTSGEQDADDVPAGSFEPPDAVHSPGASARDVAAELDDQPERQPASPAAAVVAAPLTEPAEPVPSLAARAERALRHTCAVINWPVNRYLDPEWRNTLGYAGLLTTATALALLLAALLW